jgi:acyl-CoA thioester hydrolase
MNGKPWSTRVAVRSYELDSLGHLNQAVYHQYAEHSRVARLASLGCSWQGLIDAGIGLVLMNSRITFHRELRATDMADVGCELTFRVIETFNMDSVITRVDGVVAARVVCVMALMDLGERRLLPDPLGVLVTAGLDSDEVTVLS